MKEHEREALENRIGAMSPEEQMVAVTMIDIDLLWDELRKRELEERNFKKRMEDFVCNR